MRYFAALLLARASLVAGRSIEARGSKPGLAFDKNSSPHCTWWLDYTSAMLCDDILNENLITGADFSQWNPTVGDDCSGMKLGQSYCVEAALAPAVPTKTSTTTTAPEPTSTKSSNGIETPLPIQLNMVDNCNGFYFVKKGDICATVASKHGITQDEFATWNPKVGSTCSGLWANAYACISVVGWRPKPTPTVPGNGVHTPTPTPIQPDLVQNCNKFHFVEPGESCITIASRYGVSVDEFTRWNPKTGSDCGSLWAKAYACVGV